MKITQAIRQTCLAAIRHKNLSQVEVAEAIGVSVAWVSRFLSGKMVDLSDEKAELLQKFLGVRFYVARFDDGISESARKLAERFDSDQSFASVVIAVSEAMHPVPCTPRYFPTEEMTPLGRKIYGIATDPANAGKFGKIARKVLELIG